MIENDSGCAKDRKTPHIMIDIETLGTVPGSTIASIAAVVFCPWLPTSDPAFFLEKQQTHIDIADCAAYGLTIDAETVLWWFKQSREATNRTFPEKGEPLTCALLKLSALIEKYDTPPVWAHSPAFDLVLLESAYRVTKLKAPWGRKQPRDTRTLFNLAGVSLSDFQFVGLAHDALDDAINQAWAVRHALNIVGIRAIDL